MSGGSSKKQTVGYKYYVGMHQALCHGPTDKLVGIRVGGKLAWTGANTGGGLSINASELFGGEKQEGGVSGGVDICMGAPDQGRNSYLSERLGSSMLPAFRGIMCAVLKQVYIGVNPYLKDWAWMVQRIHKTTNGQKQWRDSIAQINEYNIKYGEDVPTNKTIYLLEPNSGGWGFAYDYDYSKSPTDIPNSGGYTAPFVGKNPPLFTTPEQGLPEGRLFAGPDIPFGQYTLMDGNAPGIRWMSIGIKIHDPGSPVVIATRGNDSTLVYIDGIAAHLNPNATGGGNGWVLTPTTDTFTLTIAHPNPGFQGERSYVNAAVYQVVGSGVFSDMNPIHIIRECLIDPNWGMGYSEADIHDSFYYAADVCYDEKMGISILWSRQSSIEEFIMDILRHIDAALYVDRRSGKFAIKMIRNDYQASDMLVLNPANARLESFTKTTVAELVNEVTVTYDSHETGQVETVTVQNLAMIQQQGAIIPASIEYMGFANQATALKVAERDLRAMSTPLAHGTLLANREAAELNIGDVFWLSWPEPLLNEYEEEKSTVIKYVMRVVEMSYGDDVDQTVRIQFVEDVFALPTFSYVGQDDVEWQDPIEYPQPAYPRLVMEAPYYELCRRLGDTKAASILSTLPEAGYLFVAAGRQGMELNAEINTSSGGANYADSEMLDFCPYALLTADIGRLDTSVSIKEGIDLEEEDFEGPLLAQLGTEIVVVETISSGTATLRRGCLDTVPVAHVSGTPLLIWDGFAEGDEVEYVSSESVEVRLRTSTGKGMLGLIKAPLDSITMNKRAIRPYPPANVKINDVYFPATVELDTDLDLTWVHRDRVQQTSGAVLGWVEGGVGPEVGTTYSAQLLRTDTMGVLDSASSVSGTTLTLTSTYTGEVLLEVWSERDTKESFQRVSHTFDHLVVKIVDDAGATTASATTSGNVLANDSATGTLAVTAVNGVAGNVGIVVAGTAGGNFVIAANGDCTFDPDGDFADLVGGATRETSVTYTAGDGISSDSAVLTVTVSAA